MAERTIEAYDVIHDRDDRGDPYFPDLVDQAEMLTEEERLFRENGLETGGRNGRG